jgi:malonyl CoA-acyl carrier protein transacylase
MNGTDMLMAQTSVTTSKGVTHASGGWDTELLVLRGDDRAELMETLRALTDYLRCHPRTNLADLAFTLNTGLRGGGCRLGVIAATAEEAVSRLERAVGRLVDPRCRSLRDAAGIYFAAEPLHPNGKIAFLFPGEGAQYPGMLREVGDAFPEVAAFFAECDAALVRAGGRPLTGLFAVPPDTGARERARAEEELRRLDSAMLSVLMADWALYKLLRRLGLTPDIVAGHSMGELAALWAAEVLQTDDQFLPSVRAMMERMQRQEEDAGADTILLAVGMGRAKLADLLTELGGPAVTVAMDNCPHQAVVVGPAGPMAALEAELHRRRLVCERLPFRRPYHTAQFAPLVEPLRHLFKQVPFHAPGRPVYSCTTGRPFPDDPAEICRLAVAHWARPVRFTELITNLHADGVRLFIESGPRGNLSAFVEDILRGKSFVALPADVARRSGLTQLHHLLGCLAAHNVPLCLDALYRHRSLRRLEWRDGGKQADSPTRRQGEGQTSRQGDRQEVLARYLSVMGQFLDLQRDTAELFLRRRPANRTGKASPDGGDSRRALPLVGEVLRHAPGRELEIRRVLDLREDRFAADHTVGGRSVSQVDPDHHGLPIMPMTFTLEMMAEAASLLVPGKVVTAIHKVQLFRWLEFDADEPQAAAVVVRVSGGQGQVLVEAEVTDLGSAARPLASPATVARATLVLDAAYPVASPPALFLISAGRAPAISLERMYLNLFHGPLFRGVRSIERVSSDGIESQVEVLPGKGLFRSAPAPALVLDPVLLDVVMHPLAAWHLEQPDQAGRILLPVAVDSLEFFGPPPAPGRHLTSRGRVVETTARSFVHDVEVLDSDARLWGRLNKVKYWRLYVPFEQVNFHGPKDQYFLSQRSTEVEDRVRSALAPADDQRQPPPFAVMQLDAPPDLQQAALQRVTAQVTLTPAEREALRRLPPRSSETQRWLFDRIAAKDAIRAVWRQLQQERLFPADIDLVAESAGRFRARRRGAPDQPFPPAAVARAGAATVAVSAAEPSMLDGILAAVMRERHEL